MIDKPSDIATYKLSIKQTLHDRDKSIAKYALGAPVLGEPVEERVLMVVGATGAGKTTLINGMINYIFGVEWEDNFRLVLVAENTGQSQAHSQTDLITAYTIYPMHGSKFSFALTIIDTPGFGDTRGLTRDKKIVQQIQDFFSIKGHNGIDHLDGIGFVAEASSARLTPTQNYVFHSILSVFGNDVANNLFIMVTFADGQKPPLMDAIAAAKIECKTFYKFNNSALFACNKENSNDEDDNFDRMFWKMGFVSFKRFFERFIEAEGVSLCLTKQVLEKRKQLEVTVQGLQEQISVGAAKAEQLRKEKSILKQREDEILSSKDFVTYIPITKQRKVDLPTGRYVTNCLFCNFTCHKSCAYADDKIKYRCSAMDGGGEENAKCRVCPNKCHWQQHVNNPYRFEFYEEMEKKTSAELLEKYNTAVKGKNIVEACLEQCKNYIETVERDVITKVNQVQQALQLLDKIALKPNPLTQVDHLNLLIESEKQSVKPGFENRIKIYEKAKEEAKILEAAKNNPEQLKKILKQEETKGFEQPNKRDSKAWYNPTKYF